MKKILLALAVTGLASVSSVSANDHQHRGSNTAVTISGGSTETRYVGNLSNRRGTKVSKFVITRDAGGRVVSVKRG